MSSPKMYLSSPPEKNNSLTRGTNRMAFKCKAQRNCLIRKEISGLIKKQLKTFFARKKIQKEVQQHNKDFIVVDSPSPLEKVKSFRIKEKENNVIKLQNFQTQSEKINLRVSKILQQKRQQILTKSSQNMRKILKVRTNFDHINQINQEKVQNLKNSFLNETTRCRTRVPTANSRISVQEDRISTAQQLSRERQSNILNNYMKKMKEREERSLRKQLLLQKKKQEALKNNTPKCFISKRNNKQEEMMQKWENHFDSKIMKFEKNREEVLNEKSQKMFHRSLERSNLCEKAWEKKYANEEMNASRIISAVQNKLKKIDKIAKSKKKLLNRSQISLNRNFQNILCESQKQKHNDEMREIYNVINKLKELDDLHQLSKEQVEILKKNLDSQDLEYVQIMDFLNMNKMKFFEKKQKEEEDKMKKKGKNRHFPLEK